MYHLRHSISSPFRRAAATLALSLSPARSTARSGFTNLMVSKRDGAVVLDPHVVGSCVITLDDTAATALFDLLGEWLG